MTHPYGACWSSVLCCSSVSPRILPPQAPPTHTITVYAADGTAYKIPAVLA